MTQHLVLTIRFHDRRYHGESEWPPAPARVFQALIAGVARGRTIPANTGTALEWMEHLPPPIIAAPRARRGSRMDLFVPNNDSDSVGGDPAKIGEIRSKKEVHPHLLDGDAPLLYAWRVPDQSDQIRRLIDAADDLYQLGRGIDMAWASGEVIDDGESMPASPSTAGPSIAQVLVTASH